LGKLGKKTVFIIGHLQANDIQGKKLKKKGLYK